MKTLFPPAAAAAILSLCAAFSSCHKDNPQGPNTANPPASDLPGQDFSLTVLDHERGYDPDSLYVFEGIYKDDGQFYFGYYQLDPMVLNILPDGQNELVLKVASDATGFQGVNAASSARCINIVPDGRDHTVYHLEWVAEGESTVTLWNGKGPSRKEVSFKVTSKKEIPLEKLYFRVRTGLSDKTGTLYEMKHVDCVNHITLGGSFNYSVLVNFTNRNAAQFPGFENLTYLETVPYPLNANTPKKGSQLIISEMTIYLEQLEENGLRPDDLQPYSDILQYGKNGYSWGYSWDDENSPIKKWYKDYRWFSKSIIADGQPRARDINAPVNVADLRERRLMLWSVGDKMNQRYGSFYMYLILYSESVAIETFEINIF
mgnify:CR=1 FL=1